SGQTLQSSVKSSTQAPIYVVPYLPQMQNLEASKFPEPLTDSLLGLDVVLSDYTPSNNTTEHDR
ncbi:hypothetical protein BGZ52_008397, partial [Haplosporangium bisporale]